MTVIHANNAMAASVMARDPNRKTFKMTREARDKLISGYAVYLRRAKQKHTQVEAYRFSIIHCFNLGFEIHNGQWVAILPPSSDVPTFRQFMYHIRQRTWNVSTE